MKRRVRRFAALMVAVLLALLSAAAWAETVEIEEAVEEYGPLELAGEPEETMAEGASEDSTPVEAELAKSGYEDQKFDETLYVSDEVWSRVNLKRAKGFNGKLATVEGTLLLDDVLIEGASAVNLSLEDWFDLAPGASISCTSTGFLNLDRSAVCIDKDVSITLNPSMYGASVAAKKVKWSTSDKKIATVSSRGVVKGRKKGKAVITAKYNGDVAACTVIVNQIVLPSKIKLSKSSVTLGVDATYALGYTISPSDVDIIDVTWESSKPAVAVVDDMGVVTGLSKGEAKITARTSNGKKATCKVKVKEVKPTAVKFAASSVTLKAGETYTARVNITPSEASGRDIVYTSSDEGVAYVDDDGVIYAVDQGTAIITAATAGVKGTMKVTVRGTGTSTATKKPTAIKFTKSSISLNAGDEYPTGLAFTPTSATELEVYYTSSNEGVAYVDDDGVIYAVDKGTASITATSAASSSVKATMKVTVSGTSTGGNPGGSAAPTSISFTVTRVKLNSGDEYAATIEILPANAAQRDVYFTTQNRNVAVVDANGVIRAVGAGTTTISAISASNNAVRGTMEVVVNGGGAVVDPDPVIEPDDGIRPTSIKFKKQSVSMKSGDTHQLVISLSPTNVTNNEIYLTSSDDSVAAVDDDTGIVYAIGPGTAVITAVCAGDSRVRATCTVTVTGSQHGGNLAGSGDLTGLKIGINPGHQHKTIKEHYPIAPGSSKTAKGVKTGASGKSTHQNEYEVVLDIGLKLKRILEEHGAEVVITRTSNEVMLTNIDRAQMLNEAGVDVALQLHNNSASNSSKTGVSGYIRTTGDWVEESRAIAECLCKGMANNTPFKNLGVKIENEFMSLNWTTTPSVLLEMGYLSNRSDDKLLALDETREGLAWGIYEGLCDYFGR